MAVCIVPGIIDLEVVDPDPVQFGESTAGADDLVGKIRVAGVGGGTCCRSRLRSRRRGHRSRCGPSRGLRSSGTRGADRGSPRVPRIVALRWRGFGSDRPPPDDRLTSASSVAEGTTLSTSATVPVSTSVETPGDSIVDSDSIVDYLDDLTTWIPVMSDIAAAVGDVGHSGPCSRTARRALSWSYFRCPRWDSNPHALSDNGF